MAIKPDTASGYSQSQAEQVRATCLYLATRLGDLMDSVVVIGGLAPSLLVDQERLSAGVEPHPGTMDLDIGLHVTVLDEERYAAIADRLRAAGFEQGTSDAGKPTRQMWSVKALSGMTMTVDFLIPPTRPSDKGGRLRHLEPDFAAIIAPGLHLAFVDRRTIRMVGATILGEKAERDVHVAGPAAYTVLKALAFRDRGENKDAFDLFYVLRNVGSGVDDVATAFGPLLDDSSAQEALRILRSDFMDPSSLGPRRVSHFLFGRPDAATEADVVGVVARLLDLVGR